MDGCVKSKDSAVAETVAPIGCDNTTVVEPVGTDNTVVFGGTSKPEIKSPAMMPVTPAKLIVAVLDVNATLLIVVVLG